MFLCMGIGLTSLASLLHMTQHCSNLGPALMLNFLVSFLNLISLYFVLKISFSKIPEVRLAYNNIIKLGGVD